jgi:sensor histidine kinase YesM
MNVEERLKLTFPESVLTITSKPGEGIPYSLMSLDPILKN